MKSHDITLDLNDKEYSKLLVSLKSHYIDKVCKYEYHILHEVYNIRILPNSTNYAIWFNVTVFDYTYGSIDHTKTLRNIIISEVKLNRLIKLLKLKEHEIR